jgi:hypothetical protein
MAMVGDNAVVLEFNGVRFAKANQILNLIAGRSRQTGRFFR